jgi:hypothetical protein
MEGDFATLGDLTGKFTSKEAAGKEDAEMSD